MTQGIAALFMVATFQVAPAQVQITPERAEIEVAETAQLAVRATDGAGRLLEGLDIRWIASTPELATVDETGRVTALNAGMARITAVVGGRPTTASVVIRALPPSELRAEVGSGEPYAGQVVPMRVRAFNRLGEPVPDPTLEYRSSRPEVAAVDGAGLIFARGTGSATISVSGAGVTTSTTLTVRADPGVSYSLEPLEARVRTGDVVRFTATAERSGGEAVAAFPEWSISGTGAQVEDERGQGVFVAEEPGTYRVTARMGENAVVSGVVRVEPRGADAELVQIGRGGASEHHSGDVWVFEGLDGRDYAYIGTYMWDWMKVWDVTDASNPVLTDSLQLDARRINDVKIHPNNRIGIVTREGASSRRNGMVLLDLTQPAHPTILSEYTETLTGGVHNVWISGEHDLVYAVHNGTRAVHVIDISNPEAPHEVGRWGIDNQQRSLHDIIVQEGYAYVSYWDDGAVVLDVGAGTHGGTPTTPTFVSQYKYPIGNTHVAWRHGKYLFVGDEIFPAGWDPDKAIHARGYIHVLDMTDMENPVEVAKYEVPEAGVHNIWAEDDRLYVGYYQAGLRVLDISGDLRGDLYEQGREIAVILTTDDQTTTPNWPMAWGAQIHKGRIFSSDLNSGLWITELKERPRVVF
ncbi:MAG: Ig-like domain-containing protein [Gemmatimonadetes bacterium]|nr:Ig-like domain-containing protein [Gemmatimonadota bacterium]MDA1104641.1 Ig-like domain-containing protein [Gemmatimonadota bacterium]